MLRTLLLLIALIIVIGIALVGFGIVDLRRSDGTVSVDTRDVEVGTTERNIELPVVKMENRTVELPTVGLENETAPPPPADTPANAQ